VKPEHAYPRKILWLYIPLWLCFAYLLLQILGFQAGSEQNILITGMYFIEFGVHEVSHLLVGFLPSIFVAAAGSIGEITFTVLILVAALKARSYFATIFGALWVMLAMTSVGRYMADARTQLIPLMGPSDQPIHDWFFVFNQLGWLQYDTLIGSVVRGIGIGIGIAALGGGIWLIATIATTGRAPAVLK
jgi:hypothetical protein